MEAPADSTWKGYSLGERDRRWQAVREAAGRAGFDCIFVPLGNALDARYLTEFQNSAVVLPTDGSAPIAVTDRGQRNHWLQETRAANRAWAEPMAQALIDAGMERARIGVSGLKAGIVSHVRAFDGVVIHGAYAEVLRRLPNATFEDATDVVGFARYVKSDEEIDCLRRATAIAEAGVEAMIDAAKPGVDEAVLYARVMGRMLELGSEYYPLAVNISTIGGPEPIRRTNPPIGRRLERNTLITNEVSAVWGGQVAQEDQPILLGDIPDAWKPVIELQRDVFEAGLEHMKPGTSFGDLIDFINGFGQRRGMKTQILLHGRGYGDDGPLLTPRALGEKLRDLRVAAGNVWVWKPYAMSADERIQFVWGGDVLVTEQGGQPLFRRSHGMVTIA